MTEHDRDPVVARALRELPVPEHAPGFWERLEARLAAEDEEPDRTPDADVRIATAELPAISLLHPETDVPRRLRHRFLAAAAAVAVLALGAGLALRGGDGDGGSGGELAASTTVAPTTEAAAPFASDDVPPLPPDPVEPPVPGAPTPEVAVHEWIRALGVGDTERAVELLGPMTVRFVESQGGDAFGLMLEVQEGYGAWLGSPDLSTGAVEIPGAGVVVVLSGTYPGEGEAEQRVEAIPTMPASDGTWLVEPMAFDPSTGGRVEVVTPEPDLGVGNWVGQPPDVVFEATSHDPGALFWFALDDKPAVPDEDGRYDPPGRLPTGTHHLVVAVVGDGVFSAVAGTFVVE